MQRLLLLLGSLASAILTSYILLSSYAVVYVQAMPLVNAIQQTDATPVINNLVQTTGTTINFALPTSDQQQHQLQLLKAPKNNTKLNLAKAIERNQTWYQRPSEGHYLFLVNRQSHQLQDVIIYTTQDWRSIPNPDAMAIGDNLFLQTDNQLEYMFRINEKSYLRPTDTYVPASSDTLTLLLIVQNEKQRTLEVFKAGLVNLQGGAGT